MNIRDAGAITMPAPGRFFGCHALLDAKGKHEIGLIVSQGLRPDHRFHVTFRTDREIDLNQTALVFVEEEEAA